VGKPPFPSSRFPLDILEHLCYNLSVGIWSFDIQQGWLFPIFFYSTTPLRLEGSETKQSPLLCRRGRVVGGASIFLACRSPFHLLPQLLPNK